MSPNEDGFSNDADVARETLDELNLRLLEQLQGDDRLASGTSPGEKMNDLDFIGITGITRRLISDTHKAPASPPKQPEPKPPSPNAGGENALDIEPVPTHPPQFETVSALKEIVSELETALARTPTPTGPMQEPRLPPDPETRLAEAELLLQQLEQQPMEPAPNTTPQDNEETPLL